MNPPQSPRSKIRFPSSLLVVNLRLSESRKTCQRSCGYMSGRAQICPILSSQSEWQASHCCITWESPVQTLQKQEPEAESGWGGQGGYQPCWRPGLLLGPLWPGARHVLRNSRGLWLRRRQPTRLLRSIPNPKLTFPFWIVIKDLSSSPRQKTFIQWVFPASLPYLPFSSRRHLTSVYHAFHQNIKAYIQWCSTIWQWFKDRFHLSLLFFFLIYMPFLLNVSLNFFHEFDLAFSLIFTPPPRSQWGYWSITL